MFCNQCEQAKGGHACVEQGVCGKNEDVQSLQEILLYGTKGLAAYAHHARRLGLVDPSVDAFVEEALFATLTNVNFDQDALLELVLECGHKNLRTLQMLDEGHRRTFGTPAPTEVYEGTHAGHGILVTGHDLIDLRDLLEQTRGTGIHVYTHGEMLTAHSYPELRRYPHLVGHYGQAWQLQKREFARFSGPIVATTNCVLVPPDSYQDRVFTTRMTAVPGGTRLRGNDFGPVIAAARAASPLPAQPVRTSHIGFHHSVLVGLAPSLLEAVKTGRLKHFFVIGGCDGSEPGRSYYTEYARLTPPDSIILTVGCGKYRIRELELGTIELPGVGSVPRLLDMGQCNDSYGAIQVAVALAQALGCSVNDLPLSIVLSWFEQKAVAVLLTLLALGVRGVRIGPAAPAFVSRNVLGVLSKTFELGLIGPDPAADLSRALAPRA